MAAGRGLCISKGSSLLLGRLLKSDSKEMLIMKFRKEKERMKGRREKVRTEIFKQYARESKR